MYAKRLLKKFIEMIAIGASMQSPLIQLLVGNSFKFATLESLKSVPFSMRMTYVEAIYISHSHYIGQYFPVTN